MKKDLARRADLDKSSVMKNFLILPLAALSFSAAAQDVPSPLDLGPSEPLTIVSDNDAHAFSVEIADEAEEQSRGLMFRDSLASDAGMLFEFEAPKVASIWMKNTAIPLDILFVRENGEILKITHSATPYSLRSNSSEGVVAAVLEIPGGRSRELGIEAGDLVQHEFFGNQSVKTGE